METERKFSLLNFFYGLGAAVILIAALFKFLGWKYADILFIVGLVGEAIIFLVSGLMPVPHQIASHTPSRLEPGASHRMAAANPDTKPNEQKVQDVLETLEELTRAIDSMDISSRRLAEAVRDAELKYQTLSENSVELQKEISALKSRIEVVHAHLKKLT